MKPSKRLLSARYRQAVELLVILFRHHERKFGNIPYAAHPFGVAHIVEQLTDNEDALIAALHHDTLEDIDPAVYGADKLAADFGPKVLEIVLTVTLDQAQHSRDDAHTLYLEHLKTGPVEACLVSGADMLYNGQDMLYWLAKEPALGQQKFIAHGAFERRQRFWSSRYAILQERLGADHLLVQNMADTLTQLAILPPA